MNSKPKTLRKYKPVLEVSTPGYGTFFILKDDDLKEFFSKNKVEKLDEDVDIDDLVWEFVDSLYSKYKNDLFKIPDIIGQKVLNYNNEEVTLISEFGDISVTDYIEPENREHVVGYIVGAEGYSDEFYKNNKGTYDHFTHGDLLEYVGFNPAEVFYDILTKEMFVDTCFSTRGVGPKTLKDLEFMLKSREVLPSWINKVFKTYSEAEAAADKLHNILEKNQTKKLIIRTQQRPKVKCI